MKSKYLVLLFVISSTCFSQFSKTHYIPPLSNALNVAPQEQYLYVSCPSIIPIKVRVIQLGGAIINATVSRDTPYVYNIGFGGNTQLMVEGQSVNTINKNKGFIIEAEDLVYATVRVVATPDRYHAGGIVSKGLAALGTKFRIGAFTNTEVPTSTESHYTFAAILATENNTVVSFSDIKPGVTLYNSGSKNNLPSITLNTGESYVIATESTSNANRDGLIGALISSDKPIAVNCGSFAGTNGDFNNLDLGFDQIVSAERTGKDYIFIRGKGTDIIEKPLIVAHENNTEVYINGNTSPITTLNAGEYIALNGANFSATGNMYVKTSKNVFAYQSIGGSGSQANQNMHFVPPLSCETPKIINNIPYINQVGNDSSFTGTVNIVTETGASLDFIINGTNYSLATLPGAASYSGPNNVNGNPGFVTYAIEGLRGNISTISTNQVYVSYYGSSGAATYGGFYSGFAFKPEITQQVALTTSSNCIPNVILNVNSLTSFDSFQWFFNENLLPGAIANQYTPTQPGYYNVQAAISACNSPAITSVEIPVSSCPTNGDNDLANDNIDLDLDNDGIPNCTESFGNQNIDLSNNASGNVVIGTYLNSFIGTLSNSVPSATNPFIGNVDGSFVTEVTAGKGYYVGYNANFTQPLNLSLEYPLTADASHLLNADAEYQVNTDVNKTITVLNPTNQLLIDTNYDGIYESGVTQYSSFEIRFRLNGNVPLAAGTGNFKFQAYQVNNFKITHKNLLDKAGNKSTFKLITTCIPKDNDNDGVPDQLDLDSDNDGILDNLEFTSQNHLVASNSDSNSNGLDNAYETTIIPSDFDQDKIPDYLDLDADNDGIHDLQESGSNAIDSNLDGVVDGAPASFGTNGLSNSLETVVDNGIINYTLANNDTDTIPNYVEIDSDNDGCNDIIEAGFPGNPDPNNDGLYGNIAPPTINTNGIVTSGTGGYLAPNINYITAAPIVITTQPQITPVCELQNVTITSLADNGGNTYQWQVSIDNGTTWTNIINNAVYANTTTINLTITGVTNGMNGYKYRVRLDKVGNSCGKLSAEVTLTVYPKPLLKNTTIVQCDDDLDLISTFNLTVNNNLISTNFNVEKFTYYTSQSGANTANPSELITNPTAFTNTTASSMLVWARIENGNGCFNVVEITLKVLSTQIPSNTSFVLPPVCDDTLDEDGGNTGNPDLNVIDGIANIDLTSGINSVRSLLPIGNYTIICYRNQTDALAEINPIIDPSNYRNMGYPNNQNIWVRVDSDIDNSCFGLGPFIKISIEKVPDIVLFDKELVCTNIPTFTVDLNAGINDGSPITDYTYLWSFNNVPIIPSETNYTLTANNALGIYTVTVTNALGCTRTRTIEMTPSNAATILPATITDLVENNIIIVNVTGDGIYVYSLDDEFGNYQESNTFTNVSPGQHIIYVKDLNGCGVSSNTINLLGIPTFFTPNADGYHDTWNVKGISQSYNANTTIYIFNRYGKLLKQLGPLGNGWDGTFNGELLPADDYWYSVQFEDGRIAKGNFTLKR
jgi:gliding motility-associated-like protein